jgi:tetratricopeptide (TPR) repeat protein
VKRNKKRINNPSRASSPKTQELPPEQPQGNSRKINILLWAVAGIVLVISLVTIAWVLGNKSGAENYKDNPYFALKDYNPEPAPITKGTFEKKFSNGGQIFDWLLKNDYFEEKEGTVVHPRFLSHEAKLALRSIYPVESEQILNILQQANSSRHAFVVKSAEISSKLSDQAFDALQKKDIKKALAYCKTAIDIFPINAKPYLLLTKLYLMTGQEQKMYETLTLAGRSYPNFNNIVGVIDDDDLAKMPLEEPQDNVYLANFSENKKTAISFLFDDGEKDVYVNALPTFEKYGFRATIPVIAGMVAENDDQFWGSWREWKDAANRGFEIANHSMYHRDSQKLHGSDFDIAIDQAKERIEKNIGHKVTAYVFPHDSYSDEALSRALREHGVVRAQEFLHSYYSRFVGIVYGGPSFSVETANRLIDIGIKRQLWLLANCHGVTTKRGILSFKSITPSFLDKHLAYIHSKSDDVWVDTFTHVFEYMRLRSATTIETQAFSDGSADFVLRTDSPVKKLLLPLTVVLKTPEGAKLISVHTAAGHKIWTWSCAVDRLCVDVDAYDDPIHVEWGSGK